MRGIRNLPSLQVVLSRIVFQHRLITAPTPNRVVRAAIIHIVQRRRAVRDGMLDLDIPRRARVALTQSSVTTTPCGSVCFAPPKSMTIEIHLQKRMLMVSCVDLPMEALTSRESMTFGAASNQYELQTFVALVAACVEGEQVGGVILQLLDVV